MLELKNFIKSKIHLNETELEEICSKFKSLDLAKNSHLLRKGQLTTSYYFLQKGAIRIYFEHNHTASTAWFAFENDFFTDLSSLKSGLPSQYNIQALEPCKLYYIKNNSMERLYDKHPILQKFGRLVWESAFVNVINGIINFQTMTAKERYSIALKNPDLMQRVPLQYLASYLGITQTSLSRLRKEIK